VVNDAKHGYDVSPAGSTIDGTAPQDSTAGAPIAPSIGITAVRSPVYSWHDPKLLDPDGDYSYQDQGVQRFRYLLVPHAGDWRDAGLARRAAELGSSMRAMLESFHPGVLPGELSFVDDHAGQVMVTAVKGSEDERDHQTDLVVRAVETTGAPADVEIDLGLLGRTITASFGPSQIRSFRVSADPAEPVAEVDLVEWPLS
jgi:alpha-mannosidase